MDRLSALLGRYTFSASVFYNGEFCGSNGFSEGEQVGHLHLVRRGPVIIHHEDRPSLQIEEPTLVFYPRGLNHRLHVAPGTLASLLCATIAFQGGAQSALANALPDYLQMPLARVAGLTQTLNLLFDEASAARPGQKMVLDRLCDVLIVQGMRYALQTGQLDEGRLSGLSDAGLSRVLVAIHNDPASSWSLEKFAELSGMSRSKFAKRFHEVVGTTPADYLTDRRMSLAQKLLKRHKPVQTVALEVGYGSQPAFTKAFTARLGMSPRAWLNQAHQPG